MIRSSIRSVLLACMVLVAVVVPASAEDRKLYFGLLHSHTSYSDGLGKPEDAFAMAKAAGLHFFAVTEHNHSEAAGADGVFLTPQLHQDLREKAQTHSVDGEFLAIWGQEVSTISKGNHQNLFFTSEVCNMPNGNFKYLYETWLPSHPETTFVQLNHPNGEDDAGKEYGLDDYGGDFQQLLAASDRYIRLIEVIKGSAQSAQTGSQHIDGRYEKEYFFYLNKGFHVGPSVGGDDHFQTWGKQMHGRMGVWATGLSRNGIEEAIFNRHCYASEDDSIEVQFTANGKIMGSFLDISGSSAVTLKVSFKDANEVSAKHRVQIFYDKKTGGGPATLIENELFDSGVNEAVFTHTAEPGGYYVAKVIQISDEADDIWTAPIWLIGSGPTPLAATAPIGPAANTDDPKREQIGWADALDYLGEKVTVTGKVIRAQQVEGKIVFLNFDPNFSDTLTLIVRDEDLQKFGGVEALVEKLVDKDVVVKGEISLYRGARLQLRISDPSQIVSPD